MCMLYNTVECAKFGGRFVVCVSCLRTPNRASHTRALSLRIFAIVLDLWASRCARHRCAPHILKSLSRGIYTYALKSETHHETAVTAAAAACQSERIRGKSCTTYVARARERIIVKFLSTSSSARRRAVITANFVALWLYSDKCTKHSRAH